VTRHVGLIKQIGQDAVRRYVVPDSDPAKAPAAKRMAFKRALDWLSPTKFGAGAAEGSDWIWKIA
jgi:hypothetical protein